MDMQGFLLPPLKSQNQYGLPQEQAFDSLSEPMLGALKPQHCKHSNGFQYSHTLYSHSQEKEENLC